MPLMKMAYLAGLEAEVFPNTDLRQQNSVTVGYHLPYTANQLGERITYALSASAAVSAEA